MKNNSMTLSEIDGIIFQIRSCLDYQKYLTPINYNEENEKFLQCYNKGIEYNPVYKYVPFDDTIARQLMSIIDIDHQINDGKFIIFQSILECLDHEINMYKNIGNDLLFYQYSKKVHGVPNKGLYNLACMTLNQNSSSISESKVSAYILKDRIVERLNQYGFKWDIVVSDSMAARISVEPESDTIYINKSGQFTVKDVERLLVHEIDTHVLRAENGKRTGYKLFSSGTCNSLAHEEGLALYNEYINGLQNITIIKLYCARFITCINIEKSFYSIFDMLVKMGCPQDVALYVVPRIKRGITHTEKPGGFIKDYVYYQGFCEIKELLDGNKELYKKLYYGAISAGDVSLLGEDIEKRINQNDIIFPISYLKHIN